MCALYNKLNIQLNTLNIPINYTQVSKIPILYIRLLHQHQIILNQKNCRLAFCIRHSFDGRFQIATVLQMN